MKFTVSEPKKASGKMWYDYEQCTAPDKIHTNILVFKDGVPHLWLCVECGRKHGVMKLN